MKTLQSDPEERIFKAALYVFSNKGKDGARMHEIADEAALNKASLHYYFRSKEQLYEKVFAFAFRRIFAAIGGVLEDTETFEESLRVFIYGYIDFLKGNTDVLKLMIHENMSGGLLITKYLESYREECKDVSLRVLTQRITHAIEEGEIRQVDPIQTVISIISCCLFFLVIQPSIRTLYSGANSTAIIEQRKAHVFDLLYYGLRPR